MNLTQIRRALAKYEALLLEQNIYSAAAALKGRTWVLSATAPINGSETPFSIDIPTAVVEAAIDAKLADINSQVALLEQRFGITP